LEGINDAPDRSEQAHKRCHGARGREPGKAALQTRQLFRRGDLHGTLDGNWISYSTLAFQFLKATLENRRERTRLELIRYGRHILQSSGAAESTLKTRTLDARAAKQAPFGEDDRPRKQAETKQEEKNDLGNRTSLPKQVC